MAHNVVMYQWSKHDDTCIPEAGAYMLDTKFLYIAIMIKIRLLQPDTKTTKSTVLKMVYST